MMIPFEYSMVLKNETVNGVQEIVRQELPRPSPEAISQYAAALDKKIWENPSDPLGYVKKAIALLGTDPAASFRAAENGLKAVGDNHLLYHVRGMAQELGGKRGSAIEDMKKAVDIYPVSTETIMSVGTLLNREGRYEEAVKYWNMLIEMDPRAWMAWNGKAKAAYETGDYRRALNFANATIFCSPDTPAFYENRGQIFLETGRINEGFADYKTAVKLGSSKRDVAKRMKSAVSSLSEKGKNRDVVAIFEKALELDPENIDIMMGLLGGYVMFDDREKFLATAESLYHAALKTSDFSNLPTVIQTFFSLGMTQRAMEIASRLESTRKSYQSGAEKPGRNDPCPCGSGDKFKKCHGA